MAGKLSSGTVRLRHETGIEKTTHRLALDRYGDDWEVIDVADDVEVTFSDAEPEADDDNEAETATEGDD